MKAIVFKFIAFKVLLSAAFVYLVVTALMWMFQRTFMYFPQPAMPQELAQSILPKGKIIKVITTDAHILNAYFVPPKDENHPIILAFYGNGSSGIYLSENFQASLKKGYGVLLAEYRGYNGNEGKPTEDGLYRDAEAYLGYLATHYPDTKIIAYGQSLGSGVAIDLVHRFQDIFTAMILEVPFDSAVNVADKAYPYVAFKKIIMKDKYLSDQKIGAITIPKLFMLAAKDEVVGFDGGMRLYNLAVDKKDIRIYDDATHMTVFDHGGEKDMLEFLEPHVDIKK